MTDSIVLVGGGGHCKSCIDVIELTPFTIAGIVDRSNSETSLLGYPIIGNDEVLKDLVKKHLFLVTVGQIKNAEPRKRLFHLIQSLGGELITVISSSSHVSKNASVGKGSIIMHGAMVNVGASVGDNCIINSLALVEHDSFIGNHTHISTGALVNGGCIIGTEVFIGSGAVIAQGVQIADGVIIGAGSIVLKNIEEPGVYAGNPAGKIDA
jgi:sugar O-acyltransferase (sialic acid O-acetyltransferase NeuD family)